MTSNRSEARRAIDFGIDLGTTKSAIAVCENGGIEVIRNRDNTEFTPSAVRINSRGTMDVGRRAKERARDDPDNAKVGFTRHMGLGDAEYHFAASGMTMTPTQLSAEVLESLKADVESQRGEIIEAAVITIPAAFELHQADATRQAAALAGIDAQLLQEPTAAAFAYMQRPDMDVEHAFWLVYDFGGGTFDSAVMSLRDGECRLIAHEGDSHLGGSRIDRDIVDLLLIPAARRELGWSGLSREEGADPRWRATVAKLEGLAESAKIALSTQQSVDLDTELSSPNGDRDDLYATITRAELERIADPYYRRSIELCRKALRTAGVSPHDIARVLLVGGSTLAPALGALLADPTEGLGIEIDRRENPITAKVRGAAMFAAGIPKPAASRPQPASGVAIQLNFEPVSDDPRPLVGGTLSGGAGDWTGWTLQFVSPDPSRWWPGPRVPVRPDGTFAAELVATEGENHYRITLHDAVGNRVPINPAELTYRLGDHLVDSEAVLPASIGIGLVSGEVAWLLDRGIVIKPFAHAAVLLRLGREITRNADGGGIVIPIMQGDEDRPTRRWEIGVLRIEAAEVARDLPAGTSIEITIEITPSLDLRATAYMPLLGQDWEVEIAFGAGRSLCHRVRVAGDQIAGLEPRVRITEVRMTARLEEIARLAALSGDPVLAPTCERLLDQLEAELDHIDDALMVPPPAMKLLDSVARTEDWRLQR